MAISLEAVYERGVLKPSQPLPMNEHERVWLTIHPAPSVARQSAGLLPWKGDPGLLELISCDPEFGIRESP